MKGKGLLCNEKKKQHRLLPTSNFAFSHSLLLLIVSIFCIGFITLGHRLILKYLARIPASFFTFAAFSAVFKLLAKCQLSRQVRSIVNAQPLLVFPSPTTALYAEEILLYIYIDERVKVYVGDAGETMGGILQKCFLEMRSVRKEQKLKVSWKKGTFSLHDMKMGAVVKKSAV